MKATKRIFSLFLATFFLCIAFAAPANAAAAFPQPFDVSAKAAYMVNLDTGLVLYEKNIEERLYPASLTKLMTAIIVMEAIKDLDGTMILMPRYIQDLLYGTNSSTADIRPGETLSARQYLYALLLPSANEAACALADYVGGGSIENFVFMMNAKAKELGCTGTNFVNPHGLFDPSHYTTAYDMFLIAQYVKDIPGFMDFATTNTYTLPQNARYPNGWVILSTNKMQMTAFPDIYRSYIRGMKTGSLPESGSNFVSTASQNGENYLAVVLGATGDNRPNFVVSAQLYDWAYKNFSVKPALDIEKPITEIKVKYSSETDTLLLYPKSDMASLLPNESDESTLQKKYELPEAASAPIKAGDTIGKVTLFLAGQEIGTTELVAANDVSRNFVVFFFAKLGELFSSLYFKIVIVLTLLVLAFYIIYVVYIMRKHDKMKKVKRHHR